MALTIAVTKKSITEVMSGEWNITLNMTCLDGAEEVINQDYSVSYKLKADLPTVFGPMQKAMQKTIDAYKSSMTIYNHVKLTNVVKYLNANLVG
jgi:hypothetical protein